MVLALVPNPILGAGFESFWLGSRLEKMWAAYWWHPNQAHNGYIEIFINLGAVGIVLLLVVLANRYRLLASGWRKGDPLGTLWLAYFSVVLVFNCTEAAFFRMQAPAWLFFLLAITQRPDQLSPNTSGRRRREPAVAIEAEPLEIQTLHYSN
jgi:O-antigen ligase